MKIKHYMYVPFTGLGLYGGFRGERWFRNRLQIFKQFVVPSLLNQSNHNFTIWISFTHEQKGHPLVKNLAQYLANIGLKFIFTYHGVCFYDDKYPIQEARKRLVENLHGSIGELLDDIGEVDYVYMTIQPSDDCYTSVAVDEIQQSLEEYEAVGYDRGFITNYITGETSCYNPDTNPPFYTIKFNREDFIDPIRHIQHTSLKKDVGQYPKGTPLPSHEYVGDCLHYKQLQKRGFLVGCHGENISTYYNHPFKGKETGRETWEYFGLKDVELLKLKFSLRKKILRKLPHSVQKKLRYWYGEKLYNWLRK